MKDRDTLYRIKQISGIACAFDSFVPGFVAQPDAPNLLAASANRVVENALMAGKFLESLVPNFFGVAEQPFLITAGQTGKVRGDVFEMLCRSILWNSATAMRPLSGVPKPSNISIPAALSSRIKKRKLAVVSLGDNYDLKRLLTKSDAESLAVLERSLKEQNTSISYSTPDVVCVDIAGLSKSINDFFDRYVGSLSIDNQKTLSSARTVLEGHVKPSDILFAAGIKTSIRSDRLYQFLYEANSWKFLWSRAFNLNPSSYYVLTSQMFGADPAKLQSIDFTSLDDAGQSARRAIDDVVPIQSADDLITWFSSVIEL